MGKVTGSRATNFPNGLRTDRDTIAMSLFASSTAATTQYVTVPYKCELVELQWAPGATTTNGTPPTIVAQIGSAGTTLATLQLTSTPTAGVVQSTTTITSAAVAAGEAIGLVRATHATAYGGTASVVLKRVD